MRPKAALLLRILLGLVFCYAAYVKLREPWLYFATSISSYRLLPDWAVLALARTLPWTELAVGVVLLSGWLLKVASPAASLLLIVFYAAMLRAYAAGAGIDCACFGPGDTIGPLTLARDGALLACSLLLTVLVFRDGRRSERRLVRRPSVM
jgi:uncharacterized membrane protein YphA (DoxX/SURF4 family)